MEEQPMPSLPPEQSEIPTDNAASLSLDDTVQSSLDQPVGGGIAAPSLASLSPRDEFTAPRQTLWQRLWRFRIAGLVCFVLLAGLLVLLRHSPTSSSMAANAFKRVQINLAQVAPSLNTIDSQLLTINGRLQVASSIIISPTVQPASGVIGQIYYDQNTNQINYFNGSRFLPVGGNNTFIQNTTNLLGGATNNITNITNATAGITTTGGTVGALLKFTTAQTAGDSIAVDNSSYLQINGGLNLNVNSSTSTFTFWPSTSTPINAPAIDLLSVELGVKFTTDVPGSIKGIRFYKDSTTVGPNVGSLWTNSGTLLAQATFTTTPGNGWQEVDFPAPIPISASTTYVASYHTNGGYPYDAAYFGASGVDSGPLHALASGIDGGNGVFKYGGSSIFPSQSNNSPNYWVDVVFSGATYDANSRVRINGTQLSTNDLADNNSIAKKTSSQVFSGHNIFRNSSDGTDAFSIQKADTTELFSVDAANSAIYIGPQGGSPTGTVLVVGVKTSGIADPAGGNGAIYYNTALGMFRCYEENAWGECGQLNAVHAYTLYDEFMGGQTTSFATNDIIGSLGWDVQTIGANGTISFNPSSPAPIADRPGVLDLTTPATANQGNTLLLGNASGGSMILAPSQNLHTAVAVSSATGQVLRVGLDNETTSATRPVSGVWWEADPSVSPNWQYCYGDGASTTCTDSTLAIAANAWTRLGITVNAVGLGISSADYFINGNTVAGYRNVTIDSTNRVSPTYSCYATGNAAQSCYWDYFELKGVTSSAR
jgi:Domain of unknown function (DUF4082)